MSDERSPLEVWIEEQRDAQSVTFHVTELDVLKYNYATRQDAREYLDAAYARTLGHKGLVAAPGFVTALGISIQYLCPISELRSDGAPKRYIPPVQAHRMMAGEVDDEYRESICAGDVVTVTERLLQCDAKVTSTGRMLVCTYERRFRRDDDVEVASERYARLVVLE